MKKNSLEPKVKLVAVAKDESAYLPEWIHHHLYFGFDEIEVFVNNTSDNTAELISSLKPLGSVKFSDGDVFFDGEDAPQQRVYKYALGEAKKNFTHLMYLDIDEFWTPLDLNTSVKQFIKDIDSDVISFEWFNKVNETEFSSAIEPSMLGEHSHQIKSLFRTNLKIKNVDIHNIISVDAKYSLADGSSPVFNEKKQKVMGIGELKPAIILHRMFRGELEYVSILGRGRPSLFSGDSLFKDNRNGFNITTYPIKSLNLDDSRIDKLRSSYFDFQQKYSLLPCLERSRWYVNERYKRVLERLSAATIKDIAVVKKVFYGVESNEVNRCIANYLMNIAEYIEKNVVNDIRDASFSLPLKHKDLAIRLLEFASVVRPKGLIIKNRLNKLKEGKD